MMTSPRADLAGASLVPHDSGYQLVRAQEDHHSLPGRHLRELRWTSFQASRLWLPGRVLC